MKEKGLNHIISDDNLKDLIEEMGVAIKENIMTEENKELLIDQLNSIIGTTLSQALNLIISIHALLPLNLSYATAIAVTSTIEDRLERLMKEDHDNVLPNLEDLLDELKK